MMVKDARKRKKNASVQKVEGRKGWWGAWEAGRRQELCCSDAWMSDRNKEVEVGRFRLLAPVNVQSLRPACPVGQGG